MPEDPDTTTRRLRREPPPFRPATVRRVEAVTPRLVRVVLDGDGLEGLVPPEPAASVRLLLPRPGEREVTLPRWNGNEFLRPDGSRPSIRTLTPLRPAPGDGALAVEVVLHGGGTLSTWATAARPGDPVAVSGPGRGYAVDPDATDHLLAGDETALPAIRQLLDHLPPDRPVRVLVEVAAPAARLPLGDRDGLEVVWLDLPPGAPPGGALVGAVAGAPIGPGTQVWVAGEAAAVQRIRRALFVERGVPRSRATVRGYWKHGRVGT